MVPDHDVTVSFSFPVNVSANGAGWASANVALTDRTFGLETLPVPDAKPSLVAFIVTVTAAWSCTRSRVSGLPPP